MSCLIFQTVTLKPEYEAIDPHVRFLMRVTVFCSKSWDVFFFLCDLVIGAFTLTYIMRSATMTGAIEAHRTPDKQEIIVRHNLKMNIIFWIATTFLAALVSLIASFDYGRDPETVASIYFILCSVALVPGALQVRNHFNLITILI
jgi:hypothetical protein